MKLTTSIKLAFGLLLAAGLGSNLATATPITGSISFDGIALTNTGNLVSATAFTGIIGTFVTPLTQSGDYAGVTAFTPVTFTPFSFTAAGVTPLWTFNQGLVTYSFDATSVHVATQTSTFLNLTGSGRANITGFTSTAGTWSITDTTTGPGPVFTFGASSNVNVPDSGSTALLIALGLAGIGAAIVTKRRNLVRA